MRPPHPKREYVTAAKASLVLVILATVVVTLVARSGSLNMLASLEFAARLFVLFGGSMLACWAFVLCMHFLSLAPYHIRRKMVLERRIARGLCHACGYCLAGNTSGQCPECGSKIQRKLP